MCGRFTLTADSSAIIANFKLTNHAVLKPRYNIAPYQVIPVIRAIGKLDFLTWGFRPAWLPGDQQGFINARADTIANKPAFKDAFKKRRCLVIADGFYEWRIVGQRKQPYYVSLSKHELFAFAGIWESDTCAIITRDHKPLILAAQDYTQWLTQNTSIANIERIITQNLNLNFTTHPVSTIVNNAQHDVVACIQSLQ